jgi:UTP--glucose-1-phosphate uridylyltransferase
MPAANSRRKVKTAVFPVAGLGTRLLPATKAIPKEMLTIVDRPAIQIVVDEARAAGIEHFVFVTGRNKTAIEDHFDFNPELDAALAARGKLSIRSKLRDSLPRAGSVSFTRQQEQLGLGHAVWCARDIVGDEPFAVLLPDMLLQASPGCLTEMMRLHDAHPGSNIIALHEVPKRDVSRFGIAGVAVNGSGDLSITQLVEKPEAHLAPSNLAISGRYILQPEILAALGDMPPGVGAEIQLTDAMVELMKKQEFWGHKFTGSVYDTGDQFGYLMANVAYALARDDIGPRAREAIAELLKR